MRREFLIARILSLDIELVPVPKLAEIMHQVNEIQDPASTMQKIGWTIHSFFLVLSGLKKSFTLDMITRGQSTTIFLCIGPFSAW